MREFGHGPHIARIERDMTGDVHLHLIRDTDVVELSDGAEYLTLMTAVDPWATDG